MADVMDWLHRQPGFWKGRAQVHLEAAGASPSADERLRHLGAAAQFEREAAIRARPLQAVGRRAAEEWPVVHALPSGAASSRN